VPIPVEARCREVFYPNKNNFRGSSGTHRIALPEAGSVGMFNGCCDRGQTCMVFQANLSCSLPSHDESTWPAPRRIAPIRSAAVTCPSGFLCGVS
jgi:hypothetical protein